MLNINTASRDSQDAKGKHSHPLSLPCVPLTLAYLRDPVKGLAKLFAEGACLQRKEGDCNKEIIDKVIAYFGANFTASS